MTMRLWFHKNVQSELSERVVTKQGTSLFPLCTVTLSVINGRDHIAAGVSPPSHHDGWCWRHTEQLKKSENVRDAVHSVLRYADIDRQRDSWSVFNRVH